MDDHVRGVLVEFLDAIHHRPKLAAYRTWDAWLTARDAADERREQAVEQVAGLVGWTHPDGRHAEQPELWEAG